MWGYKPILDTDAFDEKKVLNQWITERAVSYTHLTLPTKASG